jgi:hypothetical protein
MGKKTELKGLEPLRSQGENTPVYPFKLPGNFRFPNPFYGFDPKHLSDFFFEKMAGLTGLEPATSCVTGQR